MKHLFSLIQSKNPVPVILVYYTVGLAGLLIPATRGLFTQLIPFSLLFSVALLLLYHTSYGWHFWLTFLLVFLGGYLVEVVGVRTGLLFGAYTYGENLGWKVFHTPLLIGINWTMLVYCSSYIAGKYVEPLYFRSIVAASLMVVYDFALEPAAIRLDMWSWEGGAVPLQNYLTWFLLAFALNYLAGRRAFTRGENKVAAPLFLIQMVFFLLLDVWILTEKLWV
jgi:putative membrane protein